MVSPFIGLNNRSDTQPRLQIYQDNIVDLEGVAFGALETTSTGNFYIPRVVQFRGNRNLYAFVRDGVYFTNNGGASWQLIFSPPGITATSSAKGIFVIPINGVPQLCIYYEASGNVRLARSPDGVTWTTGASFTPPALSFNSFVLYQGKLYVPDVSASMSVMDFDQLKLNASPTFPGQGDTNDITPFQDSLVYFGIGGGNGNICIVNGSDFNLRLTFAITGATTATGFAACFADENFVYTINQSTGPVCRMYRINMTSFTATEITATAIPSSLNGANRVYRILVDAQADVDGSQTYLYASSSGAWDIYRWTGSVMQLLYAGVGSTNHALPFTKNIQGSTFYEFNQDHSEIVEIINTEDGVQLSYKLWGANGFVGSASFQVFYTINDTYISQPATLVNSSQGTISGNTVAGIMADNGQTTYQVTWDAASDGVTEGARYKLVGKVVVNYPLHRRRRRKRWYKF